MEEIKVHCGRLGCIGGFTAQGELFCVETVLEYGLCVKRVILPVIL